MNQPANPFLREDPSLGIRTPGELLSNKREEYGWSQAEVARELNLSERQIVAIDNDDYDSLPGKTYVMGYWRSYANLLQISIDESIQVHRANLSTDKDPLIAATDTSVMRSQEERSHKRGALIFAMLLVVFLLAVWYWQNPEVKLLDWMDFDRQAPTGSSTVEEQVDAGVIELPSAETPGVRENQSPVTQPTTLLPEPNFSENQEVVAIDTKGYEVLVFEHPLPETMRFVQPDENVTDSSQTLVALRDDTELAESPDQLSVSVSSAEPTEVIDEEQTELVQDQAEPPTVDSGSLVSNGVESGTPDLESAAASESVTQIVEDHRIAFEVTQASWIDVRDSTGERLIYRTVNRGEDVELLGVPPYSVFIGSAEGVVVRYQGQIWPFDPHESGLFARFDVGQ